jgi:hypothetical protein
VSGVLEVPGAFQWPSWFRPNKMARAQAWAVRQGLHPTGFPLGPEDQTCADCVHVIAHRYAKTYIKCGLTKEQTATLNTDIRLKWRACARFAR